VNDLGDKLRGSWVDRSPVFHTRQTKEIALIVTLDQSKCSGHARCNAVAPEVYTLDGDGYCNIGELIVSAGLEQAARSGAANCPERALTIAE
jgi:ferredoxin